MCCSSRSKQAGKQAGRPASFLKPDTISQNHLWIGSQDFFQHLSHASLLPPFTTISQKGCFFKSELLSIVPAFFLGKGKDFTCQHAATVSRAPIYRTATVAVINLTDSVCWLLYLCLSRAECARYYEEWWRNMDTTCMGVCCSLYGRLELWLCHSTS